MNGQYIVIIGDQCETETCYGPFVDLDAVFVWTRSIGVEDGRVSTYRIAAR
jgi:hypothetical protein